MSAVVALDQATKQIVLSTLERGEDVHLFPGLALTSIRNRGVAFGALDGKGGLVALLIAAALVALLAYFAARASQPLVWLPVGLLLGGALGNLTDRVRHGAVIDFVDPVAWPAFNLADSSIVLGVPLLLYAAERKASRPAGPETASPPAR